MNTVQDRNALVTANLRLAYWVACRCVHKPDDDVKQVAALALVRAADGYDPALGLFSTYACVCVRRAIRDAVRRRRSVRAASLDALMHPDEGDGFDPPARPEPRPDDRLDLAAALAGLGADDLALLKAHYWGDEDMAAIGRRAGVSREAVRQRLEKILARLAFPRRAVPQEDAAEDEATRKAARRARWIKAARRRRGLPAEPAAC